MWWGVAAIGLQRDELIGKNFVTYVGLTADDSRLCPLDGNKHKISV